MERLLESERTMFRFYYVPTSVLIITILAAYHVPLPHTISQSKKAWISSFPCGFSAYQEFHRFYFTAMFVENFKCNFERFRGLEPNIL